MNASLPRYVPHLIALTIIAIVTILYTLPLLTRLTSAIPGTASDPDVATMVWNVGWVRRALNTGTDLLGTDAVLVPFNSDLRLHTYGLLQGFMAYPFTGILGVVGAYNLILILTLFLNGLSLYLLAYNYVQHMLGAVIAAVWAMMGTPLLFQFTVGRPTFGSIWIVCLALLVMSRLLDQPKWLKGVALGGLLLAALLTDFQIVLFTALWLSAYGLYRLWRDRRAILSPRHILILVIAGLVFGIPFFVIFYPSLSSANTSGYQQPVLESMMLYSFRLSDYVTPGILELVYGYELLFSMLLALIMFRWRGAYRFWLMGAVGILVLALGPYLQLGETRLTLPFAMMSLWSPMSNFRTPYRLAMPALIGLGMVAAYLLAYLLPRIRSSRWLVLVVILAIGGRLVFAIFHDPVRVQTYPEYAIYHQLADEPGDFVILEVPFGVRSGLDRIGRGGEILQYYQDIHQKRLLNGMIARLPASVFQFYREHPSLLFLSGELAFSDSFDADFADVLGWSSARYVLVHNRLLSQESQMTIEAFLNRQIQLQYVGQEADLLIYRVIS
ncbi:MAG: hypothetical protein K8L97_25340 [Anaerolineae bacterium]|nr:hypothetical protein [Anaerolineae bacterium]